MKDVSAGIIICNQQVLIAKRRHGKEHEQQWEFPGGKLEKGETMPECLRRELAEELGLQVEVSDFFMKSVYEYDTGAIALHAYFVFTNSQQVPAHFDHDQLRWIGLDEIDNYEFSPADIPIKNRLKQQGLPTPR